MKAWQWVRRKVSGLAWTQNSRQEQARRRRRHTPRLSRHEISQVDGKSQGFIFAIHLALWIHMLLDIQILTRSTYSTVTTSSVALLHINIPRRRRYETDGCGVRLVKRLQHLAGLIAPKTFTEIGYFTTPTPCQASTSLRLLQEQSLQIQSP